MTWRVSTDYQARQGQSRKCRQKRRRTERVRRYDPSTVTIVINGRRHTLYPVSTSDYASAFPGIGATTTITLRLL